MTAIDRTVIPHPGWCGRLHYCTAASASRTLPARGEHRSEPFTKPTAYGCIVGTLVGTAAGDAFLELRIRVSISEQESRARLRAHLIAEEIDHAIQLAILDADIRTAIANDPALAALERGPQRQQVTR